MSLPVRWSGPGPAPVACSARIAAEVAARPAGAPVPETCLVVPCPEHGVAARVPCYEQRSKDKDFLDALEGFGGAWYA